MQHYWRIRAALSRERWTVNFLVRMDGRVVGEQSLGADRSSAWTGNKASRAVSRKLGYVEDGTVRVIRRGQASDDVRLLVDDARFIRPGWALKVHGLTDCVHLLRM
jgi:hypothetical protein